MSSVQVTKTDAHTLTVAGVIDVTNAMVLKQEGEALLPSLSDNAVVDLGGVEQSGSVGVSVLLCWMRAAQSLNKSIVFKHMPGKMFDVARVSGLDEVLPLKENGRSSR